MSLSMKIKDTNQVKQMISFEGESMRKFAKRIDIDPGMLSAYMNNKKFPSPPTAKKIADGLGVEIKDIFLV